MGYVSSLAGKLLYLIGQWVKSSKTSCRKNEGCLVGSKDSWEKENTSDLSNEKKNLRTFQLFSGSFIGILFMVYNNPPINAELNLWKLHEYIGFGSLLIY